MTPVCLQQEERRRELESRAAASPPRPGNPGVGINWPLGDVVDSVFFSSF